MGLLLGAAVLAGFSTLCGAENIWWDGSQGRGFNNEGNWTPATGAARKPGPEDTAIFAAAGAQRLDQINLQGGQFVNGLHFRNNNQNVLITDSTSAPLTWFIQVGSRGILIDDSFGGGQAHVDTVVVLRESQNWNVQLQGKHLRVRDVNLDGKQLSTRGAGEVIFDGGFVGPVGSISVDMESTGVARFTGTTNFSELFVNSGTAVMRQQASWGTGNIHVNGGGTFQLLVAGDGVFGLGSPGRLVTLAGSQGNPSRFEIRNSSVGPQGARMFWDGNISVIGRGILSTGDTQDNATAQISGVITGTGGTQLLTRGLISFANANPYSGEVRLQNGRLTVDHELALHYATVVHSENGSIGFSPLLSTATFGALAGTQDILLQNDHNNPLELKIGKNDTWQTAPGYTGALHGSGSLTKIGAGIQRLGGNNANTFMGWTTVQGGELWLEKPEGSPTNDFGSAVGNLAIQSGSLVRLYQKWQIRDAATVYVTGSTLDLNTFSERAKVLSLENSQVIGGANSEWLAGSDHGDSIVSYGTSRFAAANLRLGGSIPFTVHTGTFTIEQAITDWGSAGRIEKHGTGELVLAGTSSFTGGVGIHAGTFTGTAATMPLNVGGNPNTTVRFKQSSQGLYAGVISGSSRLQKDGGGTLSITGDNTYSGGTTVNAGVLQGLTSSLRGPFSVAAGAQLNFNQLTPGTVDQPVSGTGSVAVTGGGHVTFAVASPSWSGGLTVTNSSVSATGATLGTGPVTLHGGNLHLSGPLVANPIVLTGGSAITTGTYAEVAGTISGPASFDKHGGGVLNLTGINSPGGGAVVSAGKLAVNGSLTGNVLLQAEGTLGGSGTVVGNVTGPGRVAPGNSPGILTINGDYTMTAGSVLEIEVEGTGSAGVDYDLLRVGGNVTLRGELTFDFRNNPSPALGDNITFLETFGGGEVLLVPDAEKPRITTTGLNPNSDLAVRVTSHVGVGGTVEMELVPAEDVFFDGVADSTSWFNASDWSTNSAPNETTDTRVGGNVFIQTGVAQRVIVSTQPANVRQLTVGDSMQPVVVEVETALHSVTGDVVVESNGEIELNGGVLSVGSTRSIKVVDTGSLTGHGSITGALQIGMEGTAGAMLSPGTAAAGEEVGFIAIAGSYTQGADASLAIDIRGDNSGGNHDALSIAGNATLGGRLTIDVTDLTDAEFVPGASYTLGTVGGTLAGQFDAIEVVGRDDIYFSINYGGPGALLGEGAASSVVEQLTADGYYKGDGNQDRVVDERDIPIFAAALMDPTLGEYRYEANGQVHTAAANFLDAFDFYTQGAPAGTRLVDFDDAPIFAEVLAAHTGTSLAAAQAAIAAAIAEAQMPRAVPEPATLVLTALVSMLAWAIRRRERP